MLFNMYPQEEWLNKKKEQSATDDQSKEMASTFLRDFAKGRVNIPDVYAWNYYSPYHGINSFLEVSHKIK